MPAEIIGPFRIAFDTPGLENPNSYGIEIGPALPAGTIVWGFQPRPVDQWISGYEEVNLDCQVGTSDEAESVNFLNLSLTINGYPKAPGMDGVTGPGKAAQVGPNGGHLVVAIWASGGSGGLTAGSCDVYAQVQYPA